MYIFAERERDREFPEINGFHEHDSSNSVG